MAAPTWPLARREPHPAPPSLTDRQPGDPNSQCWSKEAYDTVLPFAPPDRPDPLFIRGNFELLVPGFTGGFNDKDRSLLITWDLPILSDADQDLCLNYYASIHTHIVLSRPHGLNNGMSLAQLIHTAQKCRARGLYVLMIAVSDRDDFAVAIPWLDALKGLIDGVVACWQVDKYYGPPELCRLLMDQSAYCTPRSLIRLTHWLNGACAYWTPADEHDPNGTCEMYGVCDRFGFQRWAANYLDIHLGQLDHNTELDQLQSNNAKVLQSLVPGLRLCYAEGSAQGLYDRPSPAMALYGRQKGYYVMCSHFGGQVMSGGYLNDASWPSGEVL